MWRVMMVVGVWVLVIMMLQDRGRVREAMAGAEGEPELKYVVSVGGKSVTVKEGEAAKLEGTFTNPEVTVMPEGHRTFSAEGVTFRYPRGFTFEFESAPRMKSWSRQWRMPATTTARSRRAP